MASEVNLARAASEPPRDVTQTRTARVPSGGPLPRARGEGAADRAEGDQHERRCDPGHGYDLGRAGHVAIGCAPVLMDEPGESREEDGERPVAPCAERARIVLRSRRIPTW